MGNHAELPSQPVTAAIGRSSDRDVLESDGISFGSCHGESDLDILSEPDDTATQDYERRPQ